MQLKKAGLGTVALQSTPKPMDTIAPITRPGRYDQKVNLLATNKNTAGSMFIVGGGATFGSDMAMEEAVQKAGKVKEKNKAAKDKKKSAIKALCAEVAAIRAEGLTLPHLGTKQLSPMMRYKMPKGVASKFTSKAAIQAQYIKVKDNESEDEEDEWGDIAVVAPAVVPVPSPSPGANWKRVDVG